MGYRLSKIYTRKGDAGETGLGDGQRIAKNAPRVEAMGDVDELNAHIGLLIACLDRDSRHHEVLSDIQHRLFDLGGELAVPGYTLVTEEAVARLESEIDELNKSLKPLENFILPGGDRETAQTHVARTVCRRAERRLVAMAQLSEQKQEINEAGLKYLNRLSDYLFVLARTLAAEGGFGEVLWQQS